MSELAFTFLRAERLKERPQQGAAVVETFDRFARHMALPVVAADKASAGGVVFAVLRDGVRRSDHVERVTALVVDHDAGVVSLEEAHAALAAYSHVVHTTASSEDNAPRWRAVIELTRPLLVDEHRELYPYAARVLAGAGIVVDPACKDAARLWYWPTVRPGRRHAHRAGGAAPLDVDVVLAVARAAAEAQRATTGPSRSAEPGERGTRYAAAALGRAVQAVASAGEGSRNDALNREAFALARLPALADDVIASALEGAGRACGLPPEEVRRTIASALRARRGVA